MAPPPGSIPPVPRKLPPPPPRRRPAGVQAIPRSGQGERSVSINPDHDSEQARQLRPFLETTVPMWVVEVSRWPAERLARESAAAGDLVAHGADVLFRAAAPRGKAATAPAGTLHGQPGTRSRAAAGATASPSPPCAGEILNAIARGLAIGALQPGGVTWLGLHWCTAPHGACPGIIPAAWLSPSPAARLPLPAADLPAAEGP